MTRILALCGLAALAAAAPALAQQPRRGQSRGDPGGYTGTGARN